MFTRYQISTSTPYFQRCLFVCILAGLLNGCSSNVPELIKMAPPGNIQVAEVQQAAGRFNHSQVRWGGTIIKVDNRKESTFIEVLARSLASEGKPDSGSDGQGRFMVKVKGFLDPEEYPKDRLLTVTGSVTQVIERSVGDYKYTYPVVEAEVYFLWPEEKDYPYRYYRDPFYDPWYPFGYRYPYYW